MATEAPFLSHTQCTAGADMSSSAGLSGPNSTGQFLAVKISATRTVAITSTSTDIVEGILQNDPKAGQAANVLFSGVSKVVSGSNSIAAGARLMSDTLGRAITAATTGITFGNAIESATATGQVITVLVAPVIGAII